MGLLAVLRILLFGLWLALSAWFSRFVGLFVASLLRRTRLVAPRESAELVLVVFLFFVLLLVLAAEERRFLLPCWVLLSLPGPCLWLYLVIVDFLFVSVFGPFLRHFPSCGVPARWRDLRHVALDICRK